MFRMQCAIAPTPEVLAMKRSRTAVLDRLSDFGMRLVEGVKQRLTAEGPRESLINYFVRIARWIRVAIFLCSRIDDGALDEPRPLKKLRVRKAAADKDSDVGPREAAEALMREPREYEHLECYLDRPFGEVVALICKGLGMTPDWDAWACELWAQEEIRTQPPTSPYFTGVPPEAKALPPPPPDPIRPLPPPEPPLNRQARRAEARKQAKQLKRPPPAPRGRTWLAQRDG